jgi:D-xylose transport system permease protein
VTTSTLASHEETAPPVAIRSHSVVAERRTWRLLFLVAIMGVMWIAFNQMTDGIYITPRNLSNLAVQAAITGVVAIGVGALLIAREIDLSVGSLLGAVVVISVWLQVDHRWTALPTVLVALGFGLALGLFQGLCTTVLCIPSFIVTLAGFSYLRGVAYGVTGSVTLFGTTSSFRWFSEGEFSVPVTVIVIVGVFVLALCFWGWQRWLLHRETGIAAVVQSLRTVELISTAVLGAVCGLALWVFVSYQGLPAPVAILLAIALVAAFVGRHTAFGRHIYAIGGNPEGARRAGINVTGVVVVLFMFSGALAALGGIMQAARLDAGPPNVGLLLALDAISAAVVGGTYLFGGQGSVSGILTGTLFLASIQNGLNLKGVATFWQYIVSGVILLAAVAVDQLAQLRAQRD